MVDRFKKGQKQILLGFNQDDLDCHGEGCCEFTYLDINLLSSLQSLIKVIGPIKLLSVYRCQRHNEEVGGKPGSYHLIGKAADIQSEKINVTQMKIAAECILDFNNGGIGTYPSFIHVDVRGHKRRWAIV